MKETSTGKIMVIASEEEEVKGGEKSKVEILKISEGEFSIVHGDTIHDG